MTNDHRELLKNTTVHLRLFWLRHKKIIGVCLLALTVGIYFLGPTRTFYALDKTASVIRIPWQKVFQPSVHDWGHFASTSPIAAHEVINGIEVPPLPMLEENKQTLRGIDLNNDGVRDDIERYIAQEYGDDQVHYPAIRAYVRGVEYALENSNSETAYAAADKAMTCFPRVNKYTKARREYLVFNTLESRFFGNTNERLRAFIKAFAGKSGYDCDWYMTHNID